MKNWAAPRCWRWRVCSAATPAQSTARCGRLCVIDDGGDATPPTLQAVYEELGRAALLALARVLSGHAGAVD
ncbi:hypothetical protein GNY06_12950, partial [Elizabethkingia argentiflava]